MTGLARAAERGPMVDQGALLSFLRDNCIDCHDGVQATGKDPNHINTSNVCEDCHNNVVWTPADMVDHTQVLGTCVSCHDGNTATGKHPTHITSGDNCDDCHTTVAWIPANFDHVSITGNCASCHNGVTAPGKPAMHIPSSDSCENCHNDDAYTHYLRGKGVLVGAQNVHWEEDGPWTGEISARMLVDCGARLVEIGHSERKRQEGPGRQVRDRQDPEGDRPQGRFLHPLR